MSNTNVKVVSSAKNPADFERIANVLPVRDDEPLAGTFGRSYYPAVFGDRAQDLSFVVLRGDSAVALVAANAVDHKIGWYGMPARICTPDGVEISDPQVAKETIAALLQAARLVGASEIQLQSDSQTNRLSEIEMIALSRGGCPSVDLSAIIELSSSTQDIEKNLRRRFRSHVNWGRRNLILSHVNSRQPDREKFLAYKNLHLLVAGRSTRTDASWEYMCDALDQGLAELTLCHDLYGKLLGAMYVAYGRRRAYYASGAYDRTAFENPISHWPMLDAILRAKALGLESFEIGGVPFSVEHSEKERAIGHFKAGFVSRLTAGRIWRIPMQQYEGATQ